MPRKRMIDPEFWSDEKVSSLPVECRLLFIGIWNFSDDEGIFKCHASLLSSEIFPYDNIPTKKIEEYINLLESQNLIYIYERTGQKYAIVLNFKKHQSISHPQPSKLPKPSIQNPKYKWSIFSRDSMSCSYCGNELDHTSKDTRLKPSLDHIIPRSKGGTDLPENLVTSCEHCNKGKCDMTEEEFREHSVNDLGTFLPNISKVKLSKEKLSEVKDPPSADAFNNLVSKTVSRVGTQKPENPRSVDLADLEVRIGDQVLSEGAKHKLHNQLISLFSIRGWQPKLIKSVMQVCANRLKEASPDGDIYPYYEKIIAKYINENSDEIASQNKWALKNKA